MKIYRAVLGLALAAAMVAPALAQQVISLDNGSTIYGRMQTSINTATANVGDGFTMAVIPPFPNQAGGLEGATIYGHVAAVTRAGRGSKAGVQLAFDRLQLSDGSVASISGSLSQAQEKKQSRNGATVALATLGGMLLGNMIGKTIFNTKLGGVMGAAGGFLYGYNSKSNFTIQSGAQVQMLLNQSVTIRRQSSAPGGR
ncbi:MAG TPA: hypothetical protein VMV73_04805 [Candidatus Dormibacteraeota bacterium]|nr:hypothetical protein [Candidatus Dormibacteraeota bacterium]